MHPADIKALMQKSGTSSAAIARRLKVTANAVSLVINGHAVSARIAGAIAKSVRRPVAKLWPNKYPEPARQAEDLAA